MIDKTGMKFVGRDDAGRYLYSVLGTGWSTHTIALTHKQRCNFAALRKLVEEVRPGTRLRPANLHACLGRGSIGGDNIWLPVDADLSKATCRTIAHEMVHNDGLSHGRNVSHYAKPWNDRQAFWFTKLFMATKGWKVWPKVSGLRDTLAPTEKKRRAKAARQAKQESATPLDRWTEKQAKAATKKDEWLRRAQAATRKAKKWAAAEKRAARRVAELSALPQQLAIAAEVKP